MFVPAVLQLLCLPKANLCVTHQAMGSTYESPQSSLASVGDGAPSGVHPWWNKVEVYMNHSRTISDAKSWLTSAGYRHVIRNPSGMISMDLIMSNHCRHYLRWHLMKLNRRHDQIRPKSCRSNVAFESWYFVRYLQCGSEPTLARCGWILQCQIILCIVYEDIWWNCIADTTR